MKKICLFVFILIYINCFSIAEGFRFGVTTGLSELGWIDGQMKAVPRLTIGGADQLKSAVVKINFSPFPVTKVDSLDRRFSMSYVIDGATVAITLNRMSDPPGIWPDPVIQFTLDTNGCSVKNVYGEFPVWVETVYDLDNRLVENNTVQSGSWYLWQDVLSVIPVKVLAENTGKPVVGIRVAAEWIGRVRLFSYAYTNDEGLAEIIYPLITNDDPSEILPDLLFSAENMNPNTVRISILPEKGCAVQFDPSIKTIELIYATNGFQEILVYLISAKSHINNYPLYE